MKRIIALLILIPLLAGCSAEPDADSRGFSFTDDLGRKVSVDVMPQRVACLLGSFADVWFLAGGTVCAAPDDAWEDFDLTMGSDAVRLGGTKELSLELLLASDPDFILASSNTQLHLDWLDTLEATGIPVAYFNVSDFSEYLHMLELCCGITGRMDLYEQNGLAIEDRIQSCIQRAQARVQSDGAPTVLFLRASASSIRAKNSSGNVTGEMLKALGCINIADSDGSLLENLSIEHILMADPDYIFFVQSGDDTAGTRANIDALLGSDPAWSSLTAVREGRVCYLDKRLYNLKPNALWAEAYEGLEAILWNE